MNTVNGGSAEKMTVDQKLELLRTKMKERGMDAYMVPTADFMSPNMWEIILNADSS